MNTYQTTLLIKSIKNKSYTQKDIAILYRDVRGFNIDWALVNAAIVTRWSRAGLRRIKRMVWAK